MARAPKFNSPRTTPPASGRKAGHRAPGQYDDLGGFYGNMDGVAYGDDQYDKVSNAERRAFPDCDGY